MKVLWTDAALAQLQGIHDYLAQTSPEYALRMIDRLTKRSIQIAAFPMSGRMVPEYELRALRCRSSLSFMERVSSFGL